MIRKNWKEWLKYCKKKKKNRTVRLHYLFCTFNSIFICKKKKSNLNATQQHLQTLSCFIYSLASFNIFPLVIRVLSASSHPGGPAAPSQLETNCSSSSLCQDFFSFFFFFLWERLSNARLLHSEGLAAGGPSLPSVALAMLHCY